MPIPEVLPHLDGLRLDAIVVHADHIVVAVTAVEASATCPACQQPSTRVHSRYTRQVADLPWNGRPIWLHLQVRRFACREPTCRQRVFCERLPSLVVAYGRQSHGLRRARELVGLALGRRPGVRLSRPLGLGSSRNTLLRLVRAVPDPELPEPRVLGVDDWVQGRAAPTARSWSISNTTGPSTCCPTAPPRPWRAG